VANNISIKKSVVNCKTLLEFPTKTILEVEFYRIETSQQPIDEPSNKRNMQN
jgi:hypothetical protein